MKKSQLSLSSSIFIFFLALLLFFLGCVSFYSLDCSFPLKTSQTEDDAARRLREAGGGEAQYTDTYFKSSGELLVYVYRVETAAGPEDYYVSYILHPFNSARARYSGVIPAETSGVITAEDGFWFDYAVEYSGTSGGIEIQKHLRSIFIVLIIASAVFLSRLLYDRYKKRQSK